MKVQKILDGPKRKFIKLNQINKKMLKNEILKFIEFKNSTFGTIDMTDYIKTKLKSNYLVQFVRNFMKD